MSFPEKNTIKHGMLSKRRTALLGSKVAANTSRVLWRTSRGGFITKLNGQSASCPPDAGFVSAVVVASIIVGSALLTPINQANAQQFWDGADTTSGNGAPTGGAGTWDAATANWTDDAAGTNNQAYDPGPPAPTAIFGNVGGAVTVNGGQGITSLTFNVDGYALSGSQLAIHDNGSTINVANSSTTATIINALIDLGPGTGALTKTGAGTLILSGANTYSGTTTVSVGTLTASAANSLGATAGNVTINGGTLDLGGIAHTKGNVTHSLGTLQNGTFNVDAYVLSGGSTFANVNADIFVQTGGTIGGGTINADQRITAISGAVTKTGATGVAAANTGAGTVSVLFNAAGGVNNGAGRGVEVTTDSGDILIDGSGSVAGVNGGVFAVTNTGAITIIGTGGTTTSGTATAGTRDRAISAQILGTAAANADILINRSGAVSNTTTGDLGAGILAEHHGTGSGNVNITVGAGGISTNGDRAFGIHVNRDSTAAGSGNITIDTQAGAISMNGTGASKGIFGALSSDGSGLLKIDSGVITTANTAGHGILALVTTDDSDIEITTQGTITGGTKGVEASNGFDANGVILSNNLNGSIHVTTNATIGDGTAAGNPVNGIVVRGGNGTLEVDVNANIIADGQAIFAQIIGSGSIDIDTSGQTLTAGSVGIFVADLKAGQLDIVTGAVTGTALNGIEASFGTGVKNITTNGAVVGGQDGIKAINNAATGKITLTANANITGNSNRAVNLETGSGDIDVLGSGNLTGGAVGLVARTVSGNIHITQGGTIKSINGDALAALTTSGNVIIDGNGNVEGRSRAINGSSVSGSVTISGTGATIAHGFNTIHTLGAITATITGGANQDILINRTGAISKTTDAGNAPSNRGIHAVNSSTGIGKVTIDLSAGTGVNFGSVIVDGVGAAESVGIYAERRNGTGKVDIDSGAVTVSGSQGFGIEGLGFDGSSVEIANHGAINGGHIGIGGFTFGSGDVTIVTAAEIGNTTAPSASGIHARADGSGNVSVTANNNVTSAGEGISVDNALNNGTGNATVTGSGTVSGGARGIDVRTTTGAISITGTGASSASANKSNAIRTRMSATTSTANGITINRTGDATTTGTGATRTVNAVRQNAGAGNISVTVGNVTDNNGTNAFGIDTFMENAAASGQVIINSTAGTIDMNGGGTSKGIYAVTDGSGKIDVDSGAVDTNNTAGHGIHAVSSFSNNANAAAIEINTFGSITGGAIGIEAEVRNANGASGTIDITTGANIGGSGSGNPTTAGIKTSARDGATNITLGGNLTSGIDGIKSTATGAGSVTVTNNGDINVTNTTVAETRGIGVTTQTGAISVSGSGTVTSTSTAGVQSNVAIRAEISGTGNSGTGGITINQTGDITLGGYITRVIQAVKRSFGSGDIAVTTGNITETHTSANSYGISTSMLHADSTGKTTINTKAGAIDMNGALNNRGISAVANGTGKIDIDAGAIDIESTEGIGIEVIFGQGSSVNTAAIEIDTFGAITGGAFGINAVQNNAGLTGTITINTGADIGGSGSGNSATAGIKTAARDGNTLITLGGNVSSAGDGIKSDATGTGTITITGTGDITGGSDAGDDGIDVTAQGAVSVSVNGTITGDPGIVISSANGPIDVTGTGNVIGNGGDGISTTITSAGANGAITINRDGTVTGTVSGISAGNLGTGNVNITTAKAVTGGTKAAIAASTQAGLTTITLNAGANVSSTSGLAIFNNAGNSITTVNNGASVTGEITLGDGDDNLTFANGGFNNVTVFDGGDDISVADGFEDVLTLNGAGTVTGANIRNWEQFNISGALTVNGGGTLGAGTTTINNGGTLDAGNALALAGKMVIAAGGTFDGTGAGAGVFSSGGNVTNSGSITLADGTPGDVFTVNGDYTGGGSVSIDTELNDGVVDKTDRLDITGNSAGATVVNVNVSGGAGGSTGSGAADGIQIVSVGGTSAGTFTLGGAVSIGAFNYDLVQADGQNWFLQSGTVTNQVATYSAMQSTFQQGMATYRQRLGQRVGRSNQTVVSPVAHLFKGEGGTSQSGSGFWMKSGYSDVTAVGGVVAGGVVTKPEFYTRQTTIQIGYDKQLYKAETSKFVMGLFGEYKHTNQTVNNAANSQVSTSKSDAYGGGISATWFNPSGIYADFVGQLAIYDVTITDKITGSTAKPDVFSYSASTEIGYRIGVTDAIRFVPQAQIMLGSAVVDNFTDSTGVNVKMQNKTRFTGRLGLGLEFTMPGATPDYSFTGYGVASVIHDFSGKYRFTAAGTDIETKINPTRLEGVLGGNWRTGTLRLFGELSVSHSFSNKKYVGYKGTAGLEVAF